MNGTELMDLLCDAGLFCGGADVFLRGIPFGTAAGEAAKSAEQCGRASLAVRLDRLAAFANDLYCLDRGRCAGVLFVGTFPPLPEDEDAALRRAWADRYGAFPG